MERIGILGGTFDPVHNEHVALCKNAIKELSLSRLFVVPTFLPPHKNTEPISAEHRINMLKLALDKITEAEISTYETDKGGKSYSFETVAYYKELFPDAELFFIMGGDMLTDFKTWKNPSKIVENAKIVVFDRENFFTDYKREEKYFKQNFGDTFIRLKYVGKNISATKIRIYSMLSISLCGLVPDSVEKYIKNNGIYKPDKIAKFVKDVLPEKRLIHTANVAVTALKKIKELSLDYDKVYCASMLHDCAKYMDVNSFPDFILDSDVPAPVVHEFLGAYVAEKVVGITDEEVLDAIKYHTSGKANMTTLGKLIFVADMVEEGRTYDGVEELREVYNKGLNQGFKKCLTEEVLHLKNKGGPIYFETENAYNYYVKGEGK